MSLYLTLFRPIGNLDIELETNAYPANTKSNVLGR